ncbi:MAG TPA: hypothetical protein VF516_14510 [Kofleriaceae bacterium]
MNVTTKLTWYGSRPATSLGIRFVEFVGGHVGYAVDPVAFAAELAPLLTAPP